MEIPPSGRNDGPLDIGSRGKMAAAWPPPFSPYSF